MNDLPKCDKKSMIIFRGMVKDWFIIEMFVFLGFNISLIIQGLRRNCLNLRKDHTNDFS